MTPERMEQIKRLARVLPASDILYECLDALDAGNHSIDVLASKVESQAKENERLRKALKLIAEGREPYTAAKTARAALGE